VRTIPTRTAELTTTEAVALGLLAADGERSGYDLLKRVEASAGHIWAPAKSQLYAVLPRLVTAGHAQRRLVRQQGRPDKQLYKPTAAGRRAIRAWLEHAEPRSFDELMLKVFFAKLVPRDALASLLERAREQQLAFLEEYRAIEREIADNPERRFGYVTLRYGLELMPCRIAWIDEALRELAR
jgi:PadR family transcriptional regulator, regulatory protein AphA